MFECMSSASRYEYQLKIKLDYAQRGTMKHSMGYECLLPCASMSICIRCCLINDRIQMSTKSMSQMRWSYLPIDVCDLPCERGYPDHFEILWQWSNALSSCRCDCIYFGMLIEWTEIYRNDKQKWHSQVSSRRENTLTIRSLVNLSISLYPGTDEI